MKRKTQVERYVAEWIISDGPPDMEEFDPDLVEYGTAIFDTQKAASAHARKEAAKGPADNWWRVNEEIYKPYIYKGVDIGTWETVVSTWAEDEPVENW